MSGETAAAGAPRLSLETISKPSSPVARSESLVTDSIEASGGASAGSRARNPSTASGAPSTSSSTPRSSFSTKPPSPSSVASRKT